MIKIILQIIYIEKCHHRHLLKNPELVSNLQASVKSDLIICSYLLKIKIKYQGCLLGSDSPYVEIPLLINIPDVRLNIEAYKPTDWNPNVMAEHQFNFPLPTAEDIGIKNNANKGITQRENNIEILDKNPYQITTEGGMYTNVSNEMDRKVFNTK